MTSALGILIVGIILMWPVSARDRGNAALAVSRASRSVTGASLENAPPPIAALENCSPFYSFSGGEYLEFENDAVIETKQQPGDSDRTVSVRGAYVVLGSRRVVRITVGGSTREYALVVPTDGDQCILAAGAEHAADLKQSWYGELGDDAEDDPSLFVHAALS
jgi:hypothetical protein